MGAGDREGNGAIAGGRGLGGGAPGVKGRVAGDGRGRAGRGDGAGVLARGVGGRGTRGGDGKGAGLPELDHLFQAGEEAGQAGENNFDYGIKKPMPLHRPRRDRCAERRELGTQGGGMTLHGAINN